MAGTVSETEIVNSDNPETDLLDSGQAVTRVGKPDTGQSFVVEAQPGQIYDLDFDLSNAQVSSRSEGQLTLSFPDESKITFLNLSGYEDGITPIINANGEAIDILALFELLASLNGEDPLETAAGGNLTAQGGGGSTYNDELGENLDGLSTSEALDGVDALSLDLIDGEDDELDLLPQVAEANADTTVVGLDPVTPDPEDCSLKLPDALNLIQGTNGNNVLRGTTGSDEIQGNDGHDRIYGGDSADVIVGGKGNDRLYGQEGDDFFLVEGNDQGVDRFSGGSGKDTIHGSKGDDVITVSHLTRGDSIEEINGCGGENVLSGTSARNHIDLSNTTLTGVDRIDAGAGNDHIVGSSGDDIIIGGTGNDYLAGGAGNDTFLVDGNDQGVDRYRGGAGSDKIQGSDGDQTLVVSHLTKSDSIEEIDLGTGTNVLSGTSARNHIDLSNTTLTGVDRIDAGAGNDHIVGSSDDDTIIGGTGNDYLAGGAGNDTFLVDGNDQGVDRYRGGTGSDKIQGSDGDQTLVVSHLTKSDSIEEIDLGTGTNVLSGTSARNHIDLSNTTLTGVDRIDAGAGNDHVVGSSGDDIIIGGTGNDYLAGGDGADILIGGSGNDVLRGGAGNDRFVFDISLDGSGNSFAEGRDTIMDFEAGDTLVLSDILTDLGNPADPLAALDSLGDVSVTDGGAGRNVDITFGNGDSVTLRGLGTAGNTLDSLQDLEDHGIMIDVV
ncbi:calcium-binding protein [Kiloniella sp. EL199]|uniref:calcium-binding protein n=1 Tax=Kiloniella sp. EL199 TaxID=2107581 RepID=UPI000EA18234|nr:calcium-binding protein [Kiloniella sp. EL199]